MAEQQAGPSFLRGTVRLPGIGEAPKWAVYGVGTLAAGYVAYRWWSASSGPSDEEVEPADPGYGSGAEVIPEVEGAYPSDGSGGIPSGDTADPQPTDYGFTGTTNDEWSQYSTIQLTQSARWEYTDIVTALGRYLGRKSLNQQQVDIVQAAIAVAGYPPEGQFTIKEGGGGADTPVTVAPTGVKAEPHSATSVMVTWNEVAGATGYRIYRTDVNQNVGHSSDTKAVVGGLRPGESYGFYVRAISTGGETGPKSSTATATTGEAELKAPAGVRVKAERNGVVWVYWNAVEGAESYRVYHNRSEQNVTSSRDTKARLGGLKQGKRYTFHVRAVAGNTTGPKSRSVTVKTRK